MCLLQGGQRDEASKAIDYDIDSANRVVWLGITVPLPANRSGQSLAAEQRRPDQGVPTDYCLNWIASISPGALTHRCPLSITLLETHYQFVM